MRELPLEAKNLSPAVNRVLTLNVARCVVCLRTCLLRWRSDTQMDIQTALE